MEKVTSKDGTPIAFARSGSGPPLVLVHGTTANHARWQSVQGSLERHFTLYAVDRRGYGESGDTEPYTIEREFEDIAVLVDSIGERVNLLGHSFGALCALGATLLTRNLRKLVLYEPFVSTGAPIYPRGVVDQMQALLEAGDRDGIVTTMFRELVGISPRELEVMRSQPFWQVRVASAHAIIREIHAEEGYRINPARFESIRVPTLLLLGGNSPELVRTATKAVNGALPSSRVVVLEGQEHMAMTNAPDLFCHEVIGFLTS